MPILNAQSPPKATDEPSVAGPPRSKSAAIDIVPRSAANRPRNLSECAASPPHVDDVSDTLRPCCSPAGCSKGSIDDNDPPEGAVKLLCTNTACLYSSFMHPSCFTSFEEGLVSVMKTTGRSRNWLDKQRRQNMWTKRGYDLIQKHCGCRCKRGFLRKDLDYVAPPSEERIKRQKKKSEKAVVPSPSTKLSSSAGNGHKYANGFALRQRVSSRSSRNSDSVSSDISLSVSTQPFLHRTADDYLVFSRVLPKYLVNSVHIKMEDDGYGAGDETRSLVLSSLAASRVSSVCCVLCQRDLAVYDRYPLINGTFYQCRWQMNETAVEVESKDDDSLFLTAVCIQCLSGSTRVTCRFCNKVWDGRCHQIGTMYYFDIFASLPCCLTRLSCTNCSRPVMDLERLSFSQCSSRISCPHCNTADFHMVKPLDTYTIHRL